MLKYVQYLFNFCYRSIRYDILDFKKWICLDTHLFQMSSKSALRCMYYSQALY